MSRKLALDDISDLRAYERERQDFRAKVIALKKRRRIAVGPIVTVVFENRDTIRFQIQEMARVERIISDEGIETELAIYNPLVPEPGQLRATVFVELTDDAALREWLPKLVGVERSLELRVGDGGALVLPARPDADHADQLTREEVTASVHYVGWDLTADEIAAVRSGPVRLAVAHANYEHETELGDATVAELLGDLEA